MGPSLRCKPHPANLTNESNYKYKDCGKRFTVRPCHSARMAAKVENVVIK